MKLTVRHDIEAPLAYVFGELNDVAAWERSALRRGAEVTRTTGVKDLATGASWLIKFAFRGKMRQVALRLTTLEPNASLGFSGTGASLDGLAGIDLLELASRRTRLSVTLDVRPRTIAARVILQSLRIAKNRINRRFSDRVIQICADIETRYRQSPQR